MTNMTHLELSAWVYPYEVEGNQFILMKGIMDGACTCPTTVLRTFLQNTASLGIQHSNGRWVILWSHVEVHVVVGEGYTFHINGEEAGVVIDEDAPYRSVISFKRCYENGLVR